MGAPSAVSSPVGRGPLRSPSRSESAPRVGLGPTDSRGPVCATVAHTSSRWSGGLVQDAHPRPVARTVPATTARRLSDVDIGVVPAGAVHVLAVIAAGHGVAGARDIAVGLHHVIE